MHHIEITLGGRTPLLVNRFHEDAQVEATRGTHSASAERPAPEDDARHRLYVHPDGAIYYPAENLRQSIIGASARHKIGRRAATSNVAAALYVEPHAMPLCGEWRVDERPVVIPATRGRVLRYRPIFDQWRIEATLVVDERLIDLHLLRRIIDDAGDFCGLGDFRPARKGPYGRFKVDRWQVCDTEDRNTEKRSDADW
jgi:hypothetical protein